MQSQVTATEWREFQAVTREAISEYAAAIASCVLPDGGSAMDDPLGALGVLMRAARATDWIGGRAIGPRSFDECLSCDPTIRRQGPERFEDLAMLLRWYGENVLEDPPNPEHARAEAACVARSLEVLSDLVTELTGGAE